MSFTNLAMLSLVVRALLRMSVSYTHLDVYKRQDLDFHLALAEAVANPLILSLIDSIVGLLREQRIRIFNVEGGPQRGQVHHKRILAAMEQRDSEMARTAMRAHLEQVREDSKAPNGISISPRRKHAPPS